MYHTYICSKYVINELNEIIVKKYDKHIIHCLRTYYILKKKLLRAL